MARNQKDELRPSEAAEMKTGSVERRWAAYSPTPAEVRAAREAAEMRRRGECDDQIIRVYRVI